MVPQVSLARIIIRGALLTFALFFLITAFLRPQYSVQDPYLRNIKAEVILAIDISQSMQAKDIMPNRLVRAKEEALALVQNFKSSEIGLLFFSGKIFTEVPLTYDHELLTYKINAFNSDFYSSLGTNFSNLIQGAIPCFSNNKIYKALVILSDGENLANYPAKVLKLAKKKNIHIFSVAIGSNSGALIPVSSPKKYKRDANGKLVTTKRNDNFLRLIAKKTDGYFFVSEQNQLSNKRLSEIVIQKIKEMNAMSDFSEKKDFYQIFLFLAFMLLLVELAIK